MKLRVAILGCGAVAHRWYLLGLAGFKEYYELISVCDIDVERAKAAAKEYNVPHYCQNKEDLIDLGIDVVVVLTRHEQHEEQIRFFLENNIHVYSEKPFVSSSEAGRKIADLARERNCTLACAPQVMLSSRNRVVKEIISGGKLGKIALVRASGSNLGAAARADTNYDPSWFYQEGGSLVSLGIYTLATLIWFFGEPKKVAAFSGISFPQREIYYGPAMGKKITTLAPDNTVVLMEYEDNMFVSFDGSYCVTASAQYEFEIHGEKGSVLVGGFGGEKSVVYINYKGEVEYMGPEDDCHIKRNLAWGVEEMIKAIIEQRKPVNDVEENLMVINTIERIFDSSEHKEFI